MEISLLVLAALNLAGSGYLVWWSRNLVLPQCKFQKPLLPAVHPGNVECSDCHLIVARYSVDDEGNTHCANCKPEAMNGRQ